jgi:hypothetical protein
VKWDGFRAIVSTEGARCASAAAAARTMNVGTVRFYEKHGYETQSVILRKGLA